MYQATDGKIQTICRLPLYIIACAVLRIYLLHSWYQISHDRWSVLHIYVLCWLVLLIFSFLRHKFYKVFTVFYVITRVHLILWMTCSSIPVSFSYFRFFTSCSAISKRLWSFYHYLFVFPHCVSLYSISSPLWALILASARKPRLE